jgi:hypothetical protein
MAIEIRQPVSVNGHSLAIPLTRSNQLPLQVIFNSDTRLAKAQAASRTHLAEECATDMNELTHVAAASSLLPSDIFVNLRLI